MSSASVFAKLREVGAPTVTTREAAAALRVSTSSASRALRTSPSAGWLSVSGMGSGASPIAPPTRVFSRVRSRDHIRPTSRSLRLSPHTASSIRFPARSRSHPPAVPNESGRVRESSSCFVCRRAFLAGTTSRMGWRWQRRRKLSSISSTSAKRAGGPASACRSSIYRDRSRGARLRGGSNGLVQLDSGSS